MTTAKPGELVVCDHMGGEHYRNANCVNPRPAGATAAPQAEAEAAGKPEIEFKDPATDRYLALAHNFFAERGCFDPDEESDQEMMQDLAKLIADEAEDLAKQRDELADVAEDFLSAAGFAQVGNSPTCERARAALKKAGRR